MVATTGAMAVVELVVMSLVAGLTLLALGELTPVERHLAVSTIRRATRRRARGAGT